MPLEISLREDVVILQLLELDVLAATPVPGVAEGQAGRRPRCSARLRSSPSRGCGKPGAPIESARFAEDFRFRAVLEPMARHLEVVLAGLALHGARVALHEDVAPVPTTKIGPLFCAQSCARRSRHRSAARIGMRPNPGSHFFANTPKPSGATSVISSSARSIAAAARRQSSRSPSAKGRSRSAASDPVREEARACAAPGRRTCARRPCRSTNRASRGCACNSLVPQVVQADPRAIEPSRQQVVDRKIDARRVELLEDCANATDRLAVGVVDAGQLDERNFECLKAVTALVQPSRHSAR